MRLRKEESFALMRWGGRRAARRSRAAAHRPRQLFWRSLSGLARELQPPIELFFLSVSPFVQLLSFLACWFSSLVNPTFVS